MALTITPSTVAPGGRLEYDAPPDAQLVVGYKYRVWIDTLANGATSNGGRIRKDGIHNSIASPTTVGIHMLVIQTQAKTGATWTTAVSKPFTVATAPAPTPDPVISGVSVVPTTNGATVMWHVSPASDGQVAYGLTTAYGALTTYEPSALSDHEQAVSGLTPDTTYFYEIRSGTGRAQGMFRTLAVVVPPQPPSGDLPPPPSGQDAAALIMSTLAQRSVRLQSGATYMCQQTITLPNNQNVLDLNGATLLWSTIRDGIRVNDGKHKVGGGTLQGGFTGTGWADNNHGVNVGGGGVHEFPDLWIRDFQGDAYYLQPSWASGSAQPGSGIRITGGGFKHVGRMGLGIVHFNGGYVADWTAEDCYTPLDFEPDANNEYSASASGWLIERVKIRGKMTGSDGSGSPWLQMGSPLLVGAFHQRIEDNEVRYCDIDVTSPTTPHNALSTGTDGSFRPKNLRIHHNTVKQTYYRGALIEHTDGVVLTDNVTPVRSQPWAVLNDCKAPIDVARNT